jgi:hypothetical protein
MAENEQKRTKMPLQQAKAQVTLLFLPPGATAPPPPSATPHHHPSLLGPHPLRVPVDELLLLLLKSLKFPFLNHFKHLHQQQCHTEPPPHFLGLPSVSNNPFKNLFFIYIYSFEIFVK